MTKPRKTPPKPAPRGLEGAEARLWRQAMEGVKPLPGTKDRKPAEAAPDDAAAAHPRKRRGPRTDGPADSVPAPRAPPPELAHDRQPGMDKRMVQRLRRGKLAIEDRLDLHGLTQTEAHRALDDFLDDAYMTGKRLVIVITGKGLRPSGETGVLRRAVPRWLNEAPARAHVLGFSHAAPKDGGEGALYVRLKKRT